MSRARNAAPGASASGSVPPAVETLTGELTVAEAAGARDRLLRIVEAADGAVELDLSGVTEFDTAGLQLLLATKAQAGGRGLACRLSAVSEPVQDVLALCRLDTNLERTR